MTAYTADNYSQLPMNSEYGNKSTILGTYANLALTSAVAGDTLDFFKLPAGAKVISGFFYTTQMTGTSTIVFGVRAADGTSTTAVGTGTAILVGGTASAVVTANVLNNLALRFVPFKNDFDTIVYATFASGPVPATNDSLGLSIEYISEGTK